MTFSRRGVLAALAGIATHPALAGASSASRPTPRPDAQASLAPAPARAAAAATPAADLGGASEALVTKSGLGGHVGFALADARSGEILASHAADQHLPPASVAKTLTTAYAFAILGPDYRFETRLLATGPVQDGRLDGDLVLAGGGAPGLSTLDLSRLVKKLKDSGLREITGKFLVWAGALPHVPQIDPEQPPHLAYNPSVSGLNLNYNRVHFDWKRKGKDYVVLMDAREGSLIPPVTLASISIADRAGPVFDFSQDPVTGHEAWTVARTALGDGGERWLPVRDSALYAGEVFVTLARGQGLQLPEASLLTGAAPEGTVLANLFSPALTVIVKDMLRFSTNLTAEVLGLTATTARRDGVPPVDLADSAAEMSAWAAQTMGMTSTHMVDHSGLGDASRVTAEDWISLLFVLGPDGALPPLLHEIGLNKAGQKPEKMRLRAKTGTLNFVSALAGFITALDGRDLVFAIFTAELDKKNSIPPGDEERPAGSRPWIARSRALQYDLVRLWGRKA